MMKRHRTKNSVGNYWLQRSIAVALSLSSFFWLPVGASAETVNMADQADQTIGVYQGDNTYLYSHDASTPTTIKGGNLTVKSAQKDAGGNQAVIRLRTDSSGIKLADKDAVVSVLDALAHKLTYTNYTKANGKQRNLTGYVEITEGLTSSSLRRRGSISFNTTTGQGSNIGSSIASYNTFTTLITGDTAADTEYQEYIVKKVNTSQPIRSVTYDLDGINTLKPAVASIENGKNYAAIMPADGKAFYVDAGSSGNSQMVLDLTGLKPAGGGKVYGIYNDKNASVELNAFGGLSIISSADGTYGGALYAATNEADGKSLIKIGSLDSALSINGTGADFVGIKAGKNGDITVDGSVNITTDGGYAVVAENGGVVSLTNTESSNPNQANVFDANGKVALYAKDGGKITVASALRINGDVVATGEGSEISVAVGSLSGQSNWDGNAVGHVNVSLTNLTGDENRYWKGNFDSDGTLSIAQSTWKGSVLNNASVQLSSKTNWEGAVTGEGSHTLAALALVGRSNWVNTGDQATTIKTFTGAGIDGLKGSITSAADLAIDKFSGLAAVYYTHDAVNPTSIQGGKVTIKSADKDAAITLRTDNSGIDLSSDTVVKNVLNSLAQKLTYSGYVSGETNLNAYTEIAEGLTAGALSRKVSEVMFDKTTGAGSVANAGISPFNSVITGDSAKDTTFANRGVLSVNGNTSTYAFTEDTMINNTVDVEGATPDPAQMKYAVAIVPDAKKDIVINMNGHDLTVRNNIGQGKMAQSTTAIIYALNNDTSVTINNPGAIDLSTYSEAFYAGGIAAGKQNSTDTSPCEVTINNDATWEHAVKIRGTMGMGGVGSGSIFNVNWTGIKTFNHGHVDIIGLVDMYSYGAWCLSSIGNDGYIHLGGGKIVSQNYAAIDTYGEGTVNVNVSGSGDALTAGSNDVMIEGNLKATGQWVGAGSPGHINVALTNSKSYLAGLADNPTTGGTISLFLQNGATWTNRDGGFSYGSSASTNADGESRVTNFYGGDSEAKRGIIIQKQSGTITLDKYQGHTLAYYEHDAADPTKIIGGDLEITSAVKTGSDNAVITMRTDNSGINVDDKTLVTKVLDSLASKLSYTNYMTGERNLTGIAEISEGITSSKLFRQETIIFDGNTGVGRVSADPLGQIVTKFTTSITGDLEDVYRKAGTIVDGKYVFEKATVIALNDKSAANESYNGMVIQTYTPLPGYNQEQEPYKNVVIEAKNGLKIDGTDSISSSSSKAGIYSGNGSELTIDGNVDIALIKEKFSQRAVGIVQDLQARTAGAKATITINGNASIDIKYKPDDAGVVSTPRQEPIVGIWNKESNGSVITINGLLDLNINGTGVIADCAFDSTGVINLRGGRILTTKDATMNNHALVAYSGTINLNMTAAETQTLAAQAADAAALAPGSTKVEVEGNILTMKNAATSAASKNLLDGTINMALTTAGSYWKGVADNAGADKLGAFNLYLQNGALWINDSQGLTYNQTKTGVLQGTFDGVSHVTNFYGGDSDANRGIIQQVNDTKIAIDNYSGKTMVIYGHNSSDPSRIIGGGISITKAAAGSEITLMTDSSGIDVAKEDTVKNVLNALAGKLTYVNYTETSAARALAAAASASNLTGKVAIGEGITAPGILWKVGDIDFATNGGTGSLADGSVITPDNPIEYGQYETLIMSGAKSAMASSAMLWRAENTDMQKRLGELRLSPDKGGIWANVYGGKSKYNQNNTRYSTSYQAVQVGYDKEIDNGWRIGGAVSYNDGESDYILGGSGDNTATSLSVYGSWLGKTGHYADIVVKGGRVQNEFTVYNEMGHKVEGDYKTTGLSLSAEYGRRIEYGDGLYLEPQVQLSWGRLLGKDYTAASDVKDAAGNYRMMNISQDGFNSLVGRIGVGVGRMTPTSAIYAKAFLSHEFCGDFKSRFSAEESKKTSVDLGGSWATFQIGGSTKLSNNSNAYASVEKSVGGDVDTKWRADAGVRWSF